MNLAAFEQQVVCVDNEEYLQKTLDFWHEHVYRRKPEPTPFLIENILADKFRPLKLALAEKTADRKQPSTSTVASEPLNLTVNKRRKAAYSKGTKHYSIIQPRNLHQTGFSNRKQSDITSKSTPIFNRFVTTNKP